MYTRINGAVTKRPLLLFLGQLAGNVTHPTFTSGAAEESERERGKDGDINKVAAAALVVIPQYGGRGAAISGGGSCWIFELFCKLSNLIVRELNTELMTVR